VKESGVTGFANEPSNVIESQQGGSASVQVSSWIAKSPVSLTRSVHVFRVSVRLVHVRVSTLCRHWLQSEWSCFGAHPHVFFSFFCAS
jgi:hypothetical protein